MISRQTTVNNNSNNPYLIHAECSCRLDVFLKNFSLLCLFALFALEIGTGIKMYKLVGCEMSKALSVQKWLLTNGFLGVVSMFINIFLVNNFITIRPITELIFKILFFFEFVWNIVGTVLLLKYCQFFNPYLLYLSFVLSIIYNYILHSSILSIIIYRALYQNTITTREPTHT